MKALGIDYGTKRVGIAVSYASLAQPLTILPNDENLIPAIINLAREHQATQLVVGLSENQMAVRTKTFVTQLRQATEVPIELVDETLTSYQVHEWLQTAPAKKRQGPIDHFAAAVILENWLQAGIGS